MEDYPYKNGLTITLLLPLCIAKSTKLAIWMRYETVVSLSIITSKIPPRDFLLVEVLTALS